ncbi:cytochrome c oxidase assembly protein COX19 [Anabrus simplex]|uniref:cytochrome c oxidase assembly protein COX19 n=1 Tax=Anabrus simplex TaxID=316456 RepID=UPI0034DD4858
MSTMTFGQKSFTPTPPDKGSFPLDHEGHCKIPMLKYMICLKEHKNDNSACRKEAKDYLGCRMDNSLMAKEDWSKLGYADLENDSKMSKNN